MTIKRKVASSLLATSLLGTTFSILPLTTPAVVSSASAYGDTYVTELSGVFAQLTDPEKNTLRSVRTVVYNEPKDWWINTIVNNSQFNTKISDKGISQDDIYQSIRDFVDLFYTVDDLQSSVDAFKTNHKATFQALFGNTFSSQELLDFVGDVKTKAIEILVTDQIFHSGQSMDQIINDAIESALSENPQFQGELSSVGLSVTDLINMKDRFFNDVSGATDARNIVIKGFARKNSSVSIESGTIYPGTTKQLVYNVTYPTAISIKSGVNWGSSNTSVATISSSGVLTAKSAGTTTISVQIKGITVGELSVTVNAQSSNGGGGGGGAVTQPPASTTVTNETPGTNENGQTTNTVTVDESQILSQISTNSTPVNVVMNVNGNADVISAPISVSTINALNAKNANNSLTLQTPNGNYSVPVSELVQAIATAHLGDNAKVNLVVEKASKADQQELTTALGLNSQSLAGLTIMKVNVTSGDQTYELHTYKGYVKNVIVLDGQYDVNQLVGVQYLGALHPSAKSETVKSASVLATGNVFAPVPTTVEFKDGKTIVTLNNKTSNPITVVKTTKAFTDVTDQWFAKDVTTLANKLLITGRTTTNFVPQGILTRAEFATMIARSLGLTEATNGKNFSDVQAGDWFAGYVGAASKAGLVSGNTDGSFKPNAPVSREEAATIIMNAVKYTGGNVTLTDKEKADALAQFKDAGHASSWATDALAFAAKSNILKGSNGSINPKDKSTRAESAALLIRFLESINFISE